jgi:hypothetical protein
MDRSGGEIHDIFLVAREGVAGGLENQETFVKREVTLRIFSAKSELADIGEVVFAVDSQLSMKVSFHPGDEEEERKYAQRTVLQVVDF